jgi:hypothetical protein
MRAALNIASGQSIIGNQYLVVGYGNIDITQPESGTPAIFEVETSPIDDQITVDFRTFPTSDRGIGSMLIPMIRDNQMYFLSSGSLRNFEMSKKDFMELLGMDIVPLRINGEFTWSDIVELSDL